MLPLYPAAHTPTRGHTEYNVEKMNKKKYTFYVYYKIRSESYFPHKFMIILYGNSAL